MQPAYHLGHRGTDKDTRTSVVQFPEMPGRRRVPGEGTRPTEKRVPEVQGSRGESPGLSQA